MSEIIEAVMVGFAVTVLIYAAMGVGIMASRLGCFL
jgi:hypothetical protein